jgi:hypothetical protein
LNFFSKFNWFVVALILSDFGLRLTAIPYFLLP